MPPIDAEILRFEIPQAADEQPSANEERQRKRTLGGDK
jgi:hypothetical protein